MRACGGRLWLSLASSQGRQNNLSSLLDFVRRDPHDQPAQSDSHNLVVESLSGGAAPHEDCLAELHACGQTLDREGFRWRPTWSELRAGIRPPDVAEGEPGEWQHGWQYWSSSVTDASFRKLTLLSGRTASSRAHLRSHSGRNAGVALAHCPTAPEFTIQPHLFRTLLLERFSLATANHGGYV